MSTNIRTVLLAVLGTVALIPLLLLPVIVGGLIDGAGMSESSAGWTASFGSFGGALAAIVLAMRIHHLDLRRLATVGLLVLIISDLFSALVGRIPLAAYISLRFIAGVGGGAIYAAVMSAFAGHAAPERSYGLFVLMQFLLSSMGMSALPFVLPQIGISGFFVLLALVDMLVLGLVGLLPGGHATGQGVAQPKLEVEVILSRAALLCLFGIGLFEAANFAHFTYAERIGVSFALDTAQIAMVLGFATLTGVPGAFAVVLLGSRFGVLGPISASLVVMSAALLLLIFAEGFTVYLSAMCILGLAWAFGLPYFQAFAAELDPRGSVVTACGFATAFGAAAGPGAAAMVVDEGQYPRVLWLAIVVYVGVIALMVAATRSRSAQ